MTSSPWAGAPRHQHSISLAESPSDIQQRALADAVARSAATNASAAAAAASAAAMVTEAESAWPSLASVRMILVARCPFLVEVLGWRCLFPNMLGMMLQIPACYLLARREPDIIEAARIFKEHLQ